MPRSFFTFGKTGLTGSRSYIELADAGYENFAADNFADSGQNALLCIDEITGKQIGFGKADVRNEILLAAGSFKKTVGYENLNQGKLAALRCVATVFLNPMSRRNGEYRLSFGNMGADLRCWQAGNSNGCNVISSIW